MDKSQEIFQEIEKKLIKDDYASTLPVYHPAKGRRKKNPQEAIKYTQGFGPADSVQSQNPFPGPENPGIPDPGPEIDNPDTEEIDPSRDFPQRDIEYPKKEEFPDKEQNPEIDDPDEEEFYS
jgi:hypothetical protein